MLRKICIKLFVLAFGFIPAGGAAHAQEEKSADEIAASLQAPVVRTRGAAKSSSSSVESLTKIWTSTRSLKRDQSEELYKIAEEKPQIDLPIFFDFNSAEIAPQAMRQLNKLGAALARPEFHGRTFMVGGHTDGKGAANYNRDLSRRRAEAVQTYLVNMFRLDPGLLVAAGYGSDHLKDQQDPFSGENRRVQIVRLGE
jgi:outer membrane protein OmpA-like peptidoglycan-associated protein